MTQLPETLYDRDFYLWAETTAKLLAQRKFVAIALAIDLYKSLKRLLQASVLALKHYLEATNN